ncbi:amidohydrolase family protein [Roseomonas marmotae]|uniref:Amidohydrolase family protein n=1 Tax=Roseomonas marmotae TaxID=2768161 RepID=A0ABS3KAX6_9PROT|nr:amidohydrolase family protein [Roseomonas marmotae]MBO1074599.1 amidohydrolase family protein [Roseomonas marmotae]QTI81626.1 amidohydrolase family protein [Roseomonas marmotae]
MARYDLIIRGGRLLDPETGLDAVGDVAIRDGRIEAVGRVEGEAARVIEAAGLAVAPGFIDLHAHGQSIPADRMQAFDGVTTSLELEVGVLPVGAWYEAQAQGGRVLNYGTAVAWVFARIAAMTGLEPEPDLGFMGRAMRDKRWADSVASDAEVAEVLRRVREGLDEGGIGIGLPNAYAPGTGVKEMSLICSLAADRGVPTYTHVAYMSNVDPMSSIEAYTRLIGYAGSTGAHMHICHFNSTSLLDVERAAQLVRKAQDQGLKITVEAYPYGSGSTVLGAVFFSDPAFPERTGRDYGAVQMVDSGHRFRDREELVAAQEQNPGSLVLFHFLDVEVEPKHRDLLDVSILYPDGAIASDAMPWTMPDGGVYTGDAWPLPAEASSHPRSSGTFTRFLRQWVIDRQTMSLLEGVRKCTLIPAQILEESTPQMRRKGRLQPGCDADIVVFDAGTLIDRADFKAMNRPAEGMRHVLVNGQSVIRDGELDPAARPGRPVRR